MVDQRFQMQAEQLWQQEEEGLAAHEEQVALRSSKEELLMPLGVEEVGFLELEVQRWPRK